ncbi:GAF domain-containing protein [Rhodovarius lipocyclicus]|uniref:DUF484 family protein n=1 Tax=Rhodovarius lipocyclicus TaxID=268410 RepID=UPI00135772A2|nr:DUF484 family protein [Rhodovarius lipocyclicus]
MTARLPTRQDVEAWLRANPGFLAENPELYLVLAPPARVHGEAMADHMAAMLAAARDRVRAGAADMQQALASGRAGTGLAARAQEAVLALMRARDPLECVTQEWPALLGLDSCLVGCERTARAHVARLPAGTLKRVLPAGREAILRPVPRETELFHREAAPLIRRDALARIPSAQPMLLALGAREPEMLPGTGLESLIFLGRAIGAALSR